MSNERAYSAIGGAFEYLNSDCDYPKWSEYIIELLKSNEAGSNGLDIGCGNGYFTRALERAGYSVMGMDISREALSTAVKLARAEGVKAEFLQGDITKLKLCGKVAFITAINDCVNYVPPQKILPCFKRVYSNLKKGGLFVFDISSPKKLKNLPPVIVRDMDEATLVWFNTIKEDSVTMELSLFSREEDGRYTRRDESQTQYIHTEESLLYALREAGFETKTEGHLGKTKEERINFICKKA